MPPEALLLVLVAAALHAGWNALAKRAGDSLAFIWSANAAATVGLCPWAAWELGGSGWAGPAVPFVAASVVLHALYFYTLGRAYALADYSIVYPVARGLSVALVPVAALVLLDEWPSRLGAMGIALVIAGIVVLHRAPVRRGRGRAGTTGTGWAVATGVAITSYSLVDKAGVMRLHPAPYLTLTRIGESLLLLPAVLGRPGALGREWARNWRAILAAAGMAVGGYLLVLFAFRLAKVGYVVAVRESSIVLSAIIGALWLGEGRLGPRLGGAAVVLAGVACVALAR